MCACGQPAAPPLLPCLPGGPVTPPPHCAHMCAQDKTPAPLGGLDTLMSETYDQVLSWRCSRACARVSSCQGPVCCGGYEAACTLGWGTRARLLVPAACAHRQTSHDGSMDSAGSKRLPDWYQWAHAWQLGAPLRACTRCDHPRATCPPTRRPALSCSRWQRKLRPPRRRWRKQHSHSAAACSCCSSSPGPRALAAAAAAAGASASWCTPDVAWTGCRPGAGLCPSGWIHYTVPRQQRSPP